MKTIEETRVFLLIDDAHPNYYVGRIIRKPGEMRPEIWDLPVGQVRMTDETRGFEREA